MIDKDKIKFAIERHFLKIRGWKDWAEYDRIRNSSELDINTRIELIDICIYEILSMITKEINELKKYGLDDDNGCNDPDCCGGRNYWIGEMSDGEYIKIKDALSILNEDKNDKK